MSARKTGNGIGGDDLAAKRCVPCEGGVRPLAEADIGRLMARVGEWRRKGPAIQREFRFKDFHETMAFVNAVAWVANRENHHPDLEVGYDRCLVRFSTHAIGGLSENDFIAAAKVDALT